MRSGMLELTHSHTLVDFWQCCGSPLGCKVCFHFAVSCTALAWLFNIPYCRSSGIVECFLIKVVFVSFVTFLMQICTKIYSVWLFLLPISRFGSCVWNKLWGESTIGESVWTPDVPRNIASQITSLVIVYSAVYSDADQRKHQSSASQAFVRGIHRNRWILRTDGQ